MRNFFKKIGKKKENTLEEYYKNEGIAIFVKGQLMVGIHSDNIENNTKALNDGSMKIDWERLLSRANEKNNN